MLFNFGSQSQKFTNLFKSAELLMPSIKGVALVSFDSLKEDFSEFNQIRKNEWDFYFTIAAVTAATVGLQKITLDSKLKSEISKIYGKDLDKLNENWDIAFKNCNEFLYERILLFDTPKYEKQPDLRVSDTLGWWLLLNIIHEEKINTQQVQLIRPIGIYVTKEFIGWFEE